MQIMGDVETVREKVEQIAEQNGVDEIMVTTNVYDHHERLRSYERLAEVFEVAALHS
jgi:alkanesulfonate monooxygenase SsuD/methylene tetrahydromethanopterin reductase-like flavin-dependent oxidoreductase (luciferase family)